MKSLLSNERVTPKDKAIQMVMSDDKITGLRLNISSGLHTQFKACAAKNSETMTDILVKCINDYINKC